MGVRRARIEHGPPAKDVDGGGLSSHIRLIEPLACLSQKTSKKRNEAPSSTTQREGDAAKRSRTSGASTGQQLFRRLTGGRDRSSQPDVPPADCSSSGSPVTGSRHAADGARLADPGADPRTNNAPKVSADSVRAKLSMARHLRPSR